MFTLLKSSKEEIRQLALKGQLAWEGKKVSLDPFQSAEVVFQVEAAGQDYCLKRLIYIGSRETSCQVFKTGVLEGQIFRFWKEESDWMDRSEILTLPQLKEWFDQLQEERVIWKCPIPKWKPDPLPILVLKDRTGAFADLWMDYGPFGKVENQVTTREETFWEKDLLETDFIKKKVGDSHYFCPMDKVVKSLTFLLDVGWTILDFQGKKVVRKTSEELSSELKNDSIVVRGRVQYGDHEASIQDVMGSFNRREKFVNLSPSEVGLLEIPAEWTPLAEEEVSKEGILIKRNHVGLLEDIVSMPPEYQVASWENVVPSTAFQGDLFPYQQKGFEWLSYLYRSRFSGLLADEMGLGKTIQVVAFLSTLDLKEPALIVMPVSLQFHWKREIEKFMPTLIHHVMLTSYAKLRQNRLDFESKEWSAIILDEAQAIKNPDSLTAEVVCRLRAPFKLALTGTPIENRYEDLWSIFRFLMPDLLGERKMSTILERVQKKIRPFTLRRTKKEVDLQLPEKVEQIVWVDSDQEQRDFYDAFLKQGKGRLSSQKVDVLQLILRLKQICCHPKLVTGEYEGSSSKFEKVCSDIEDVVLSGNKVIVYSQFTSMLLLFKRWLEEKSWPYAYLDGETWDRENVVASFQEDPKVQIFLISLKAGGVGLNLQAADYVFLYDPWWNLAAEKQAIDRAHRVGRKSRVIARKYLMTETIEEKILKLQLHKQSLSENLLEFDEEISSISMEELYALLHV